MMGKRKREKFAITTHRFDDFGKLKDGSEDDDSDYVPDEDDNNQLIRDEMISNNGSTKKLPSNKLKAKIKSTDENGDNKNNGQIDMTVQQQNESIDQNDDVNQQNDAANQQQQMVSQNDDVVENEMTGISTKQLTVQSIKIKKNSKSKHKMKKVNWAIVSDEDDDGEELPRPKRRRGRVPKKAKTKKPSFVVRENGDFSTETSTKNSTHQKSPRKRKDCKYDQDQDKITNLTNKISGAYQLKCLIKPIEHELGFNFPAEVCMKIFNLLLDKATNQIQELIKLSQVCETWRKLIISSPLLWRYLDLRDFPDDHSEQSGLYTHCDSGLFNNVQELNLSNWNGIAAERVLARISSQSKYLKSVSLKNCKYISPNFLDILSNQCPELESLDISGITSYHYYGFYEPRIRKPRNAEMKNGVHSPSTNIFNAPIWRPFLERSGRKLLSLILADNSTPTFSNCLSAIMEYCPNLQVLDLCNVESISKSSTIAIQKLQLACPQLRVLRAANISLTVSSSQSSPGFVHLEELSIPSSDSGIAGVITTSHTDTVIEELTKSSEKLKLLDIRGSRLVTPRALVKIPAWNIQLISLSNCPRLYTDQLGLAFSKWNSSLIDVDLSWNVNENSVVSCLKSLCEAGHDSQLRSIQLRGSAVPYDELKRLLESCQKLESIDLQSCRGLPRGIKRTFSGHEFVSLREEVMMGKYD